MTETERPYQSLETLIRERYARKLREADGVGEKGIVVSSDPATISGPPEPETPPNDKNKKKKGKSDEDDPNVITIGKVTPVDLQPTTEPPNPQDAFDKRDKKIVEEKAKTLGKGIHFINYHNSIRHRVMNIFKTNQNLVDKHKLRARGEEKPNEEIQEVGKELIDGIGSGKSTLSSHENHQTIDSEISRPVSQTSQQEATQKVNEILAGIGLGAIASAALVAGIRGVNALKYGKKGTGKLGFPPSKGKRDFQKLSKDSFKDVMTDVENRERKKDSQSHGPHIPIAPVPIVTRGYTKHEETINELAKAELERIAMYHRAGNAEAGKKRRKYKVIQKVRQTIAGITHKPKKVKEEMINEAPTHRVIFGGGGGKLSDMGPHRASILVTANSDEEARKIGRKQFKPPEGTEKYSWRHINTVRLDKEETIDEAGGYGYFDPAKAMGQLVGQVLTTAARSRPAKSYQPRQNLDHLAQTRRRRHLPPVSEFKRTKPIKSIVVPSPEQSAPPVPPKPDVQGRVRAYKGIDFIRGMEQHTGKPFDIHTKMDWKKEREYYERNRVSEALDEGAMKNWLMDMEWHVTELDRKHKGDVEKMKTEFLKKYPGQERVFHNQVQTLRGGDDSDRWAHEVRKEDVNEARDKAWKAYPLPGSKKTAWGFAETRPPKPKDYFRGYYGEITAGSKDKTVPVPKKPKY